MDIGKDVLTRTLLGSTEAEKVFTPWWITLHHYLVYAIVILGLIALPINCMLSVNGNCSYKFSAPDNYVLPMKICNVNSEDGSFRVERRYCSPQLKRDLRTFLGAEMIALDGDFEIYNVSNKDTTIELLKQKQMMHDHVTNYRGCLTKSNPRLFGFFVYWHCVNQLSALALYFPYLVLTLALILVLLERLLTRYLWTGQRIEKFYSLLVKEVMDSGDIERVDTKENKQKCQQVLYDFRNSWFFCRAYILQTYVKLGICSCVLGWSLLDQCNLLRESFKTEFECKVFDYVHGCSIPSNGMNLIIFDLCNVALFLIIIDASFNLFWHYRFYGKRYDFIQTKLGRLINRYEEFQRLNEGSNGGDGGNSGGGSSLSCVYHESPDLQMLLNLLAEKEGIWAALIILCLFDRSFRSEFRVRDTKITSTTSEHSSRRKDVTLAWNEPRAASFIGENVPKEHLMYVLEINPPIDKSRGNLSGGGGGLSGGCLEGDITMMPACAADGKSCVFTPVERKMSDEMLPSIPLSLALAKLDSKDKAGSQVADPETHLDKFKKHHLGRTYSTDSGSTRSTSASSVFSTSTTASSRRTSAGTSANTPDRDGIAIVDGVHHSNSETVEEEGGKSPEEEENERTSQRRTSSAVRLRRVKTALMLSNITAGIKRRRSAEKVRNFSSTFAGLRADTDYVITVSFVLSGRKLGSESFTILSHDGAGNILSSNNSRKHSAASCENNENRNGSSSPKTSFNNSIVLPDSCEGGVCEKPDQAADDDASDGLIVQAKDSEDLTDMVTRCSEKGLVVLEFVASWCGLCNIIAPQMELMAEEFGSPLPHTPAGMNGNSNPKHPTFFLRADIDSCAESAKEYGIQVLPSILLIRHDEVVDSFIGQQLSHVQEAIVRIRQEEAEAEMEEKSINKTHLGEDESKMRMRKVSAALEAVVTDPGYHMDGGVAR